MNDTPRTDDSKFWSIISGWVTTAEKFQELELELNAANERIKRLEKAGDELMRWRADPYSVALWRQAKEAKP